jgi:2,3,4,5-tetrahydropyridine-2-carboxylate N-succinyltransferase
MAIETVATTEAFKALVNDITSQEGYRAPIAFGIARVDRGQKNAEKILQANFGLINYNENFGSAAVFIKSLQEARVEVDFSKSEFVATLNENFVSNAMAAFAPYLSEATDEAHKNVQVIKQLAKMGDIGKDFRIVFLFEDGNPESVEAVYLKLYALSLGKVPLRGINLNGAFGILPNVAWSGNKPHELDYLRENEIEMKLTSTYPVIDSVDKFPRYLQHVIPADNTRILETSKVRMGAQLAAGTTVMPGASYINFNAGTLGAVMVEGRISSSAVVGKGSDVGGGASILGVLSGTDGNPISIGENTLLGANSVVGMPIGDGCFVEMGVEIHESLPIFIEKSQIDIINEVNESKPLNVDDKKVITMVYKNKAGNEVTKDGYWFIGQELIDIHGLQFRDDKLMGVMIAFRSQKEVKLNDDLH